MANECLVTKLKAVVDNDNLETLGFIKVIADNSANNGQVSLMNLGGSGRPPLGTYIVGSGTFVNGKTVVDDIVDYNYKVPANTKLVLMWPKYDASGIYFNNAGPDYAVYSLNLDDFIFSTGELDNTITRVYLNQTGSGLKSSGNAENALGWYGDSIERITATGSNIELDLNTSASILKFKKLQQLLMQSSPNIKGSLSVFFSRFAQANAAYLKTRNDSLRVTLYGSGVTNDLFGGVNITFVFTESSTVNIRDTNSSDIVYTYDIDTNIFTPVNA